MVKSGIQPCLQGAVKLDRKLKLTLEDNDMLRVQFQAQEDDREYLVRREVAVRKENDRLRTVGLYKLNPVYHSLKAPGFNP